MSDSCFGFEGEVFAPGGAFLVEDLVLAILESGNFGALPEWEPIVVFPAPFGFAPPGRFRAVVKSLGSTGTEEILADHAIRPLRP